jgi:hypothetical protein
VFRNLARRVASASLSAQQPQQQRVRVTAQQMRFYADAATALTLNLTTPHRAIIKDKSCSLVTMPGAAGYFGKCTREEKREKRRKESTARRDNEQRWKEKSIFFIFSSSSTHQQHSSLSPL